MKLTELIERLGNDERVKARLVRFLTTERIIDPPRGTRANPDYGEDHVEDIRRYLSLRDLGFSLTTVRNILRGNCDEVIPVEVAPGVTLQVTPSQLDGSFTGREVAARVVEIVEPFYNKNASQAKDARHDS